MAGLADDDIAQYEPTDTTSVVDGDSIVTRFMETNTFDKVKDVPVFEFHLKVTKATMRKFGRELPRTTLEFRQATRLAGMGAAASANAVATMRAVLGGEAAARRLAVLATQGNAPSQSEAKLMDFLLNIGAHMVEPALARVRETMRRVEELLDEIHNEYDKAVGAFGDGAMARKSDWEAALPTATVAAVSVMAAEAEALMLPLVEVAEMVCCRLGDAGPKMNGIMRGSVARLLQDTESLGNAQ